uniref:Secreted protein n=1 Tax=Syphacia muris TaxID=451379 RepID=A0A0N5A9Z0_9BILA
MKPLSLLIFLYITVGYSASICRHSPLCYLQKQLTEAWINCSEAAPSEMSSDSANDSLPLIAVITQQQSSVEYNRENKSLLIVDNITLSGSNESSVTTTALIAAQFTNMSKISLLELSTPFGSRKANKKKSSAEASNETADESFDDSSSEESSRRLKTVYIYLKEKTTDDEQISASVNIILLQQYILS